MAFVPYRFFVRMLVCVVVNKRNEVVSMISISYPAPRRPTQPDKADTVQATHVEAPVMLLFRSIVDCNWAIKEVLRRS